jgi:hypothetical protein
VKVHVNIIEGNRSRIQVFQGVVISRNGHGVRETFAASTDFTVGLEEEFQLLDPRTMALVQKFEEVFDSAPADLRPHLAGELITSEVEYKTSAHARFVDAARDLVQGRLAVIAHAESLGIATAITGCHPFSPWQDQRIINTPHYERVAGELGYIAWINNTWSQHLHVGKRVAARLASGKEIKCTDMRKAVARADRGTTVNADTLVCTTAPAPPAPPREPRNHGERDQPTPRHRRRIERGASRLGGARRGIWWEYRANAKRADGHGIARGTAIAFERDVAKLEIHAPRVPRNQAIRRRLLHLAGSVGGGDAARIKRFDARAGIGKRGKADQCAAGGAHAQFNGDGFTNGWRLRCHARAHRGSALRLCPSLQ